MYTPDNDDSNSFTLANCYSRIDNFSKCYSAETTLCNERPIRKLFDESSNSSFDENIRIVILSYYQLSEVRLRPSRRRERSVSI